MSASLSVTATLTVPASRINDMLCCAFEGGSTYWCAKTEVKNDDFFGMEWAHEVPMAGGTVFLTTHDTDSDPLPFPITKERCEIALNLLATHHPRHFADLMAENDDADTGDIFLQLAAFNEVLFG